MLRTNPYFLSFADNLSNYEIKCFNAGERWMVQEENKRDFDLKNRYYKMLSIRR